MSTATPVSTPRWRLYFVWLLLLALFCLLVFRMASLQLVDSERGRTFLKDQGDMRMVRNATIPAYRGLIADRRGEPLAVSTPVTSIWGNPQLLRGSPHLAALADALGMSLDALRKKLKRRASKQFTYLVRHWQPDKAQVVLDLVRELEIEGVGGKREYRRFYPAGEVAAQLVGFTDVDGEGIDGLELAFDEWLRGKPGKKKYIYDRRGDVVRDIGVVKEAVSGRDITLSIDLRLQYLQHRELRKAVGRLGASSGSVVTLDSRTGEVLAMVNYPVYNPNMRKDVDIENLRNRAVTDVYEPGSTVKALTLVAALESGRFTPHTLIDTAPGYIRVGSKVYPDPKNYGEITLTRIMQKSSQVGVTKLALDLGHEPIWDVFRRFGLGVPPGSGFPGESAGYLPNPPKWHVSEKVALAFGYGLNVSALQLASAYSVFANGGVLQPVTLQAMEGEVPPGERVISTRTAAQVLDILHAVTADEGTAWRARVPGYEVGGKTGTVHKVGKGGYQDDYIALFAGVAPIDDPRVVTVVVIDDPKSEDYGGGAAAAPLFSAVTEEALRILNIPPSQTGVFAKAKPAAEGGAT